MRTGGDKHELDIICISETKYPFCSTEGGQETYVDEIRIKGNWKLFFSTSVNPKQLEKMQKLKKAGQGIAPELRQTAVEHAGVAIAINRRMWDQMIDVRPKHGRMMSAIIKTKPEINIAVVDAPHSFRDREEKETFYDELFSVIGNKSCNSGKRMWVIAGDFNARAGKPQNNEEEKVLGKRGFENARGTVQEDK